MVTLSVDPASYRAQSTATTLTAPRSAQTLAPPVPSLACGHVATKDSARYPVERLAFACLVIGAVT